MNHSSTILPTRALQQFLGHASATVAIALWPSPHAPRTSLLNQRDEFSTADGSTLISLTRQQSRVKALISNCLLTVRYASPVTAISAGVASRQCLLRARATMTVSVKACTLWNH